MLSIRFPTPPQAVVKSVWRGWCRPQVRFSGLAPIEGAKKMPGSHLFINQFIMPIHSGPTVRF